jgi:hypothetical protein
MRPHNFADLDNLLMGGWIVGGPHHWYAEDYGFMPQMGHELGWKRAVKDRLDADQRREKAAKALRVLPPDVERLNAIADSYELVA